MNTKWMNNLHDWQRDGFIKVLTKCNRSELHNVIPVNASVGSGKTFFGSLAIADFIDLHRNEKTIQIFITPRIKLCSQQSKELTEKISTCEPYGYQNFTEFPGNGSPFQVIPVDCTHREWSRHNDHLDVQHAVFIICDASLWGDDKNAVGQRWNAWRRRFKAWKKAGYIFGNIIFDEAHNFKNDDKVERMFGTTLFKKHRSIDYVNNECLLTYFQNVILLSGTPADYQKNITSAFQKNVCECPLNVAINEEWVERPVLNLVNIEFEASSKIFSNAIIKVLEHEIKDVKPINGVHLLVNFGSIDEIDEFEKDTYIQSHMGKDFHFIAIHSDKLFKENDIILYNCKSMIDGKTFNSGDVYDLLEGIDSGKSENKMMQPILDSILDGKPIMVGQVAMIGEGINICSFNSVITKSNSDTTAMQQIGRVLRKYKGKKLPNVYCVYDNVTSLKKLLSNLMIEHSLTADCFDWGKRLDPRGGSSNNEEDDGKNGTNKSSIEWIAIDPNLNADIQEIQFSEEFRRIKMAKNLKTFTDSDAYDNLIMNFADSFSDEDVRIFAGTMKRSNAATGDSKLFKVKMDKAHKNKTEKKTAKHPQMNETISTDKNTSSGIATVKGEVDEAERTEVRSVQGLIFELVKTIRGYVLRSRENEHIMKVIKEHPEYLIQFEFSYIPQVANKIVETGIYKDQNFLRLVGLD